MSESALEDLSEMSGTYQGIGIKGDKKHSAEAYLQSFIITHAEKFLNDKGRQIIGWDEILEGGLLLTQLLCHGVANQVV